MYKYLLTAEKKTRKKNIRKELEARKYIIVYRMVKVLGQAIERLVFDIYFSLMITKMINDQFNLERKQNTKDYR